MSRIVPILALVPLLLAGCLGAGGDAGSAEGPALDAATPEASANAADGAADASGGAATAPSPGAAPTAATVEPASGVASQTAAGACVTSDAGYTCCCVSSREAPEVRIGGANASGVVRFSWDALTPQTAQMHVAFSDGDGRSVHAVGESPLEVRFDAFPPGAYVVGVWFAGAAGAGVVPGYADQEVAWSIALDP